MDESTIKVLLIDDEPGLLDVSKQFLELDRSISADTTISGEEVLELIVRQEYDVIVSDYQMPLKDGIQLLKEIRATGNRIPFIIFTGKGREEVAIEALNAGADFYLQKGSHPTSQFAELSNMIKQAYSKKVGERALAISEARLRIYIDNAPEGIFIVDAKGNYLDANKMACSMLKYSYEELLSLNIMDIADKSMRQESKKKFHQLLESGAMTQETILARKDGIGVPVFLNAVELPNKRYMAFCTDITERKRAVDALKESEERYRLLVESAAESIVVIQDGLLRMVNRMAIKVIGHPEKELLTESFCSFVHPDDRSMVVEKYQRRIMGETVPARYELRLLTKERNTKWFEISAVVIDWEGRPATLNFLMDITERKRAEEALRESETRFRELAQMLPVAVYEANLQGILTFVNQCALEMFGYSQQDFSRGVPSLEMLMPDDRERGQRNILKGLHGENQGPKEYTARRKDGSAFSVSIISTAILHQGKPIGIRGVVTDITGHKSGEEAMRESERKRQE
jgi:PAS domain S-box-containing protein